MPVPRRPGCMTQWMMLPNRPKFKPPILCDVCGIQETREEKRRERRELNEEKEEKGCGKEARGS